MIVRRHTIDDLYDYDGAAELIDGQIVDLGMAGKRPGEVGLNIAISLRHYAKQRKRGVALADGVGFVVGPLANGRESFLPDASYSTLPSGPNEMRYLSGPPNFAVEVRSENDFGGPAEVHLAAKRADYFEAGTDVVWDVDPVSETVSSYSASEPDRPRVFRKGDVADAEPAVPGWRMSVDDVFEKINP